jgi:hypothetical protein
VRRFDLIVDVLDKQLVDRNRVPMGRVDGLVLEVRGDDLRVRAIETGFVVLARRLHPRLERWLRALRRKLSVRRTALYRIDWSKVLDVDAHYVQVDVDAERTPAYDWERWLRRRVVGKVPGEKEDQG